MAHGERILDLHTFHGIYPRATVRRWYVDSTHYTHPVWLYPRAAGARWRVDRLALDHPDWS